MFDTHTVEIEWAGRPLKLETGKIALDIPSPNAGTVISLHVAPGERAEEGQLILLLDAT